MKTLADLPDEELFQSLRVLPAAYQGWIKTQTAKINTPALSEFTESVHNALSHCSATQARIEACFSLLETNQVALSAFRFANEAMYLQRIHSQYAEKRRTLKNWDNLPGITEFDHATLKTFGAKILLGLVYG